MASPRTITLAFTGASGLPYGLRLLECLLAGESRVFLVYSPAAQVVARHESDLTLPAQPHARDRASSPYSAERIGWRRSRRAPIPPMRW